MSDESVYVIKLKFIDKDNKHQTQYYKKMPTHRDGLTYPEIYRGYFFTDLTRSTSYKSQKGAEKKLDDLKVFFLTEKEIAKGSAFEQWNTPLCVMEYTLEIITRSMDSIKKSQTRKQVAGITFDKKALCPVNWAMGHNKQRACLNCGINLHGIPYLSMHRKMSFRVCAFCLDDGHAEVKIKIESLSSEAIQSIKAARILNKLAPKGD